MNHRAELETEAKDIGAQRTRASSERMDTKSATAPAKMSDSIRK